MDAQAGIFLFALSVPLSVMGLRKLKNMRRNYDCSREGKCGPPVKLAQNCTSQDIIAVLDYTLLNKEASLEELRNFCETANTHAPAAVCVYADHVEHVKKWIDKSILVAAVCGGFPVGSSNIEDISQSIQIAVKSGADEIDCVLEPRQLACLEEDELIRAMREASDSLTLKVIVESPLLSDEELRSVCKRCLNNGADFIKSCTGKRGKCTQNAAKIMSEELQAFENATGISRGIKVSGGIQTKDQALKILESAATCYPTVLSGKSNCSFDCTKLRIGASSLLQNILPAAKVGKVSNGY